MRWWRPGLMVAVLILAGCNLPVRGPALPEIAVPAVTPDPTFAGQPFQDARALFGGVCFNYWVEQANRGFLLTSAADLITFYNEVDESALCRFPVIREPFDFETGRILIGVVNVGTGCQAFTDPLALVTDAATRTVTMHVRWGVTGDCNYRLARPFWVSIPRPPEGYTVQMAFEPFSD